MASIVMGSDVQDLLGHCSYGSRYGLVYDRANRQVNLIDLRIITYHRHQIIIRADQLGQYADATEVVWTAFPPWVPEPEADSEEGISDEMLERCGCDLAPFAECEGYLPDDERADEVAAAINAAWMSARRSSGVVA